MQIVPHLERLADFSPLIDPAWRQTDGRSAESRSSLPWLPMPSGGGCTAELERKFVTPPNGCPLSHKTGHGFSGSSEDSEDRSSIGTRRRRRADRVPVCPLSISARVADLLRETRRHWAEDPLFSPSSISAAAANVSQGERRFSADCRQAVLHYCLFAGEADFLRGCIQNTRHSLWQAAGLASTTPLSGEAILRGDEPDGISFEKLRRELPVRWDEQRERRVVFGGVEARRHEAAHLMGSRARSVVHYPEPARGRSPGSASLAIQAATRASRLTIECQPFDRRLYEVAPMKQAPRHSGPFCHEMTVNDDGSVVEFQRGKDKDIQNERNVPRVAKALGIWLTANCVPATGADKDGADAYLYGVDDARRLVQITRAVDGTFCKRVAQNPDAKQDTSLEGILERIASAIKNKTSKWTRTYDDPKEVVLAVDVDMLGVLIFLASHYNQAQWQELQLTAAKAGWFDVVLVGDIFPGGLSDKMETHAWSLRGVLRPLKRSGAC
ncbi:MAG: hypothetical protein WD151_11125 [Phycisphaeraceae bacterium]